MLSFLFAMWLLSTTLIVIILWFIIKRLKVFNDTSKPSNPELPILESPTSESAALEPSILVESASRAEEPFTETSLEPFMDSEMEEISVNQKPFLSREAKFSNTLGYFSGPFLFPDEKDQDRIYGGLLNEKWPCVILADGVTSQPNSATYAELAVKSSFQYLSHFLPKKKEPTEVISLLEKLFLEIQFNPRLQEQVSGATTLLIALLWEYKSQVFWFYAYEGNGLINLVSPSRKIQGIEIPSALLSPQKVSQTACLSKEGLTVPPFVGCTRHQAGDLLYVASDGMIVADKWLTKQKENASRLDVFLVNNWKDPEKIQKLLSECQFTDDAAMGMICTISQKQ